MTVLLLPLTLLAVLGVQASDPLFARQTPIDPSIFPPACQAICTPISNIINECQGLQCICTESNAQSLEGCMDCVVTNVPSSASEAQNILNTFSTSCSSAGIQLSPISLSTGFATTTSSITRVTIGPSTTSSPGSSGSTGNPFKKGGGVGRGEMRESGMWLAVLGLVSGVFMVL